GRGQDHARAARGAALFRVRFRRDRRARARQTHGRRGGLDRGAFRRMTHVAVVFHSARGHTRVLADAVARGAAEVPGTRVALMAVESVDWDVLARADALVFGCPTFMGGPSAAMKAFMDASSHRAWATRAWKDKLAAGFTNSSGMSGDKLGTL